MVVGTHQTDRRDLEKSRLVQGIQGLQYADTDTSPPGEDEGEQPQPRPPGNRAAALSSTTTGPSHQPPTVVFTTVNTPHAMVDVT